MVFCMMSFIVFIHQPTSCLPSGVFPPGLPTDILYIFTFFHSCYMPCPYHPGLAHSMAKSTSYEAARYVFYNFLSHNFSSVLSTLLSDTLNLSRWGGFSSTQRYYRRFYYLFKCYMFRSYDHLHADIFSRTLSTDNGYVVFFRILDIIVNYYSDRIHYDN
jgi:hypothetical protein